MTWGSTCSPDLIILKRRKFLPRPYPSPASLAHATPASPPCLAAATPVGFSSSCKSFLRAQLQTHVSGIIHSAGCLSTHLDHEVYEGRDYIQFSPEPPSPVSGT